MAKGSVWVDSEGLQVHPTTQEDKPHVPHIPDDVEQEIDPTQPDQNDQVESRAAAGLFLSDVMIDEKCSHFGIWGQVGGTRPEKLGK